MSELYDDHSDEGGPSLYDDHADELPRTPASDARAPRPETRPMTDDRVLSDKQLIDWLASRAALAAAQADVKRLETDYRQLELDSKALAETIEHMGDRIRERNETVASLRSTVEKRTRELEIEERVRIATEATLRQAVDELEERTRERDAAREDGAMLNNAEAGQWGISPQVGGGWVIEISSGEDVVEIARTRGTLRAALSLAAARPTPERAEPTRNFVANACQQCGAGDHLTNHCDAGPTQETTE